MARPRVVLIANPAAGVRRAGGAAERFATRARAGGFEIELLTTERAGHAEELARTIALYGVAALCPVGGDGTVHELVNGLLSRVDGMRPALCIVPAGSGNALARDLGYESADEAAELLAEGSTRAIDAARVELDGRVRYAINIIGWGAVARIDARAERLRLFGGARYTLAAALELLRPRLPGEQALVDGVRRSYALLGAACLTRHSGRGMRLAPEAELDDGLFDVLLIRRAGRLQLARVLSRVYSGRHTSSPLVSLARARSLRLELDPGAELVVDGELVPARSVKVAVERRLLRVFCRPRTAADELLLREPGFA